MDVNGHDRTDIEEMTLYDAPDSDSEGDGEGPSLQFHTGTKGGGLRPAMYHGHADEERHAAQQKCKVPGWHHAVVSHRWPEVRA